MSAVMLLAASVVSWLLRVGFITIVPARRLPDGFRRVLDSTAVAALAALLATGLARGSGTPGVGPVPPVLVAAAVAALVAWRTRRMGLTVGVAVAVLWLLQH